jgi:hypothetical protein
MVLNTFPNERPIALAEQVVRMKQLLPDFSCRWKRNIVSWIGYLQPTALSCCYKVKVTHQLHQSPCVHVLNPSLQAKPEESIPHIYPGQRLCLYHPKRREWSQQMYIAETIIPWASSWLMYYERWHMTGEWLGGGEHPNLVARRRRNIFQLLDD